MSPHEVTFATRWRDAAQLPVGVVPRAKRVLRNAVISMRSMVDRRLDDRFLRCLFCHYVFDDQITSFDRILGELQKLGTFISTAQCVAMLRGEQPLTGRHFHLSFDDGFRNNLTNAAPILRERGVPAIFFVPSAIIGSDARGTAAYCSRIEYPAPIELMDWDDVALLVAQGFDIGSHTRTHARFSDVSRDTAKLEDEIAGSKREIEERLRRPCRYISWPYGKVSDADRPSLAMAERAGYDACFGAFRGSVHPGQTHPFAIPRHHFEAEWPVGHVTYFARGKMEQPPPALPSQPRSPQERSS